jgi:ABC-2 type transport system ATP-binding protein
MKRKLEIVRSLMHRPVVLFLDEPTSGLDPDSRRGLWDYLKQVRAESGTTVFLTTHYLEEAEGADAVCIINAGKVVALGTPAALKEQLTVETLGIDAADREALRADLRRLGVPFVEGTPFTVPLAGRNVHALLKAIQTSLSVVRTHAPTLEDAYLAIVRNES